MNESRAERVERHIGTIVTMALRPFAPLRDSSPTLPGIPSARDEMIAVLVAGLVQAVRGYDPGTGRPALFLARAAADVARRLHHGLCTSGARPYASCRKDAAAAARIVDDLALSLFDLQVHGDSADIISAAVNADDLDDVQRLDGLAAKLAELLHPHPSRREALPIVENSAIVQLNSPYRNVDQDLYDRNRTTHLSLADVVRRRGLRADVTSDYASPGRATPGQEFLVRTGLFRAAAVCFLLNGAGPGTGRAIELANSALTPILLLRRVTDDDPEPPNENRFAGEVTGLVEYRFSVVDEARELLDGFLSTEADNIRSRQRELVRFDSGHVPEEAGAMIGADESAFHGRRISIEDARFWTDPLHFPYAGVARQGEIRHALGLPPAPAPARRRDTGVPETSATEERSMRSLAAYSRVRNLGPERVLRLWTLRFAYGPTDVRRELPQSVEDWEDIDRRTAA